jgi:hypothetical protein
MLDLNARIDLLAEAERPSGRRSVAVVVDPQALVGADAPTPTCDLLRVEQIVLDVPGLEPITYHLRNPLALGASLAQGTL